MRGTATPLPSLPDFVSTRLPISPDTISGLRVGKRRSESRAALTHAIRPDSNSYDSEERVHGVGAAPPPAIENAARHSGLPGRSALQSFADRIFAAKSIAGPDGLVPRGRHLRRSRLAGSWFSATHLRPRSGQRHRSRR